MRTLLQSMAAIAFLASQLRGQTLLDLNNQVKSSTKAVKIGPALPASCKAGDVFLNTTAPGGQNVFTCLSDNLWVPQGGGTLTIQGDGVTIGTEAVQNFVGGFGLIKTLSNQGSRLDVGYTVDPAVVQTHVTAQSGRNLYCESTSGSATAYTCELSPMLTAYQAGMVLNWRPDVTATGGATTLAVSGLTATRIKAADGISDPTSVDVQAGQLLSIWYDGSTFRLVQPRVDRYCESGSGSPTAYTCAVTPAMASYRKGTTLLWKPDISSSGGGTTLAVNGLAATVVKMADGTSDPTSADIVAGRLLTVWYDGSVFRLQHARASNFCESGSGSSTAYTCALAPALTGYQKGMSLLWKPDLASTGGPISLAINGLAVIPIKLADGISNPTAPDVAAGRIATLWYDGAVFRLTQTTTNNYCESTGRSGTEYTCSMAPSLTAYLQGLVVNWLPDVDVADAPITLAVDGLAPVSIKLSDGVTNPTVADMTAGKLTPIWYDGSVFRLLMMSQYNVATGARPTCNESLRGRFWFSAAPDGAKDDAALCAKDSSDGYAWRVIY